MAIDWMEPLLSEQPVADKSAGSIKLQLNM